MLFGAKTIASELGVTIDRLRTLISAGAPIRVVDPKNGRPRNGVRYMANRKALFDWVCCRDLRKMAKAG